MFNATARFLVIDDSAGARENIRSALSQIGLKNLDEADNGKVGLEKVKRALADRKPYSIVFCDVNMPVMDGLQFLETLRSEPTMASVPVLMITTESEKSVVIRAVMQGVSGYVVKPFGIEEIRQKVEEIFRRISLEHTGTTGTH